MVDLVTWWNLQQAVRAADIVHVLKQGCCFMVWLRNGKSEINFSLQTVSSTSNHVMSECWGESIPICPGIVLQESNDDHLKL